MIQTREWIQREEFGIQPTDWRALIARLGKAGYRYIDIGEYCGRSESTIGRIAKGELTDPPTSVGDALRALDARVSRGTAILQVRSQR